jgi:hypothetical protein
MLHLQIQGLWYQSTFYLGTFSPSTKCLGTREHFIPRVLVYIVTIVNRTEGS